MIGNIQAVLCNDGTVNLIGKQGTTWELFLSLKNPDGSPMNLTGVTFRGQFRASYGSTNKAGDFSFSIIDVSGGKVLLSVSDTVTASTPAYKDNIDASKLNQYKGVGVYVYDIEMIDATNKVSRILEGRLFNDPESTKDDE